MSPLEIRLKTPKKEEAKNVEDPESEKTRPTFQSIKLNNISRDVVINAKKEEAKNVNKKVEEKLDQK